MPEIELNYESNAQPPKGALSAIFFIVFTDLMGFGIIIPLLPLYAAQYHASRPWTSACFSPIYSASSPVRRLANSRRISDRYGRRPVLIFSQLGSSLGYLLLGLVMNFHWVHPFYALLAIFSSRFIDGISGGNISTAQAYISDVTTPQNRVPAEWARARARPSASASPPAPKRSALLVDVSSRPPRAISPPP